MVLRRPAEPRVAEVALPLPAGRVPLRGSGGRERPARPRPARVRAAGHRGVRRRPLLGGRGGARQGRPARPADGGPGHQRGAGDRHAARAAAAVVPQHVGLGCRRAASEPADRWARAGDDHASAAGRPPVGPRRRSGRGSPAGAVLRQRHQHGPPVRRGGVPGVPEGRDQRPRRDGFTDGEPRGRGDQVRRVVPADRGTGPDPGGARAAAPTVDQARVRQVVRQGDRGAQPRGRRLLRRGDPQDRNRRRAARRPAGVRRDDLGQAVLLLRRGPLAGRGPHPTGPAAGAPHRPQCSLDPPGRSRHPVHARPVGVPVVRRVGPGLPHHRPGPHRPGVRQVPAAGDVPRVVPAPERGDPGLRVGIQRREPPRARVGRAARVGHRRPA